MEEGLSNLKWSYHKIKFFENLKLIRKKSNYTDATLAVDGKFYPVHKLVMSLFSEYFSDIFEQTSCKSPVIVLKDVRSHEIEALLDYMYLGEVNVNQNDLASLLKTAECLRIEGLAAVPDKNQTKIFKNSTSSHGDTARGSPPPKRRRQDSNRLPQCTPSIQKSASASATASSSSSASVLASRVHSHSIPPNSSSNNEKDEFLNFVKVEMDDLEEHDESLRRENNYDGDASNELDPSGDYWSDISITEHEDDLNVSQSGVVHQQPIIQKQQHRKQQQQPQQMPSRLPKPPTGYIQTIAERLMSHQEHEALEFYQINPILWDRQEEEFNDTAKKSWLVAEQAEKMGVLPCVLTGWFRSQRTIYGRLKKRGRPGQAPSPRPTARQKWVMKSFQFLDEHVQFRDEKLLLGQGPPVPPTFDPPAEDLDDSSPVDI